MKDKLRWDILLVGFGDLAVLEGEVRFLFPGCRVFSARTVQAGLEQWESDNMFVQPVHLLPGFEYEKLLAAISCHTKNIEVGKPLLHSEEAITCFAEILHNEYGGKPTLFVGHGSGHPVGKAVYTRLSEALQKVGFSQASVAVLEGQPDLDISVRFFRQNAHSNITLVPLTLTAGKHMREDILGNHEASMERRLISNGFMVKPVHRCLLTLSPIRQMFLQNIAE
ncbi:MAG: sirohydrochlorin cobaltochelatase [Hungatella sp.]|jgi:sirohydrochlorin cobaltochelatase|nr:sirohydrochlorin cobaltochelatase [Hungatella sp.]